jgi:hypothetical protein
MVKIFPSLFFHDAYFKTKSLGYETPNKWELSCIHFNINEAWLNTKEIKWILM